MQTGVVSSFFAPKCSGQAIEATDDLDLLSAEKFALRSTELQVSRLVDYVKRNLISQNIVFISLDIQNAFDGVWYQAVVTKLFDAIVLPLLVN